MPKEIVYICLTLMSLYHYPAPSLLDNIAFVKTENGGLRAYLHARGNAKPEELSRVTALLKKEKLLYTPFSADDKHSLEVRGFSSEDKFIKLLANQQCVKGKPKVEQPKEGEHGWWDSIMKRSLQISGLLYLVGDANFIAYGLKEKNYADVTGGIFYLLGTLALVAFGRNDQADIQMQDYAKKLEDYLVKENVGVPSTCSLHNIADDSQETWLQKLYKWMRGHPAEMFNTIYIGAGASIAYAALKGKIFNPVAGETAKDQWQRRASGIMDFMLGTTTATVSLLGNVIEEKKPDPDEPPPRGFLQKAWNWIREKPLRLTGYGLMASTMCHAGSTAMDFVRARRNNDAKLQGALVNRAVFVGTNLLAEGLMALSSKGHGEGVMNDESVKDSIYSVAAELVTRQPKEDREWLLQRVASYLQQPNMLADSFDKADATLRKHVAALEKNPWTCLAQNDIRPSLRAAQSAPKLRPVEPTLPSPHMLPDAMAQAAGLKAQAV